MSRLLIKGGRLLSPTHGMDAIGDLLIEGDRIAAVGEFAAWGEERAVEATGLLVLPGLMDMHVHLREPGQEHKETIATGTRAAAAGGFATVVAEPNTSPPRDTPERVQEVLKLSAQRAVVRVMQKGAITMGQEGRAVADIAALQAAGAVAASDDGRSVWDDGVMRAAFLAAKAARMPLTVHVDEPRLMARDIALSEETDWPVHFSHVSLEEEVTLIWQAQQRGLRVTGEASPHHLALCREEAPEGDPNFRMNPPLRSARDREALRWALAAGVISVVASDHAPHTAEEKATEALPGVIGLETTVGVIWRELVHEGLLDLKSAVARMTAGPASVLGVHWPTLTVANRADVTLVDPEVEWTVEPEQFQSRGRNCPFAGRRLKGRAVATIVSGRMVMEEGTLLAQGVTT